MDSQKQEDKMEKIVEKDKETAGGSVGIAQEVEPLRMVEEAVRSADVEETKSEQRTITVDQDGNGDYGTIGEALEAAPPETTIKVKYGTYEENIVIEKNGITILGSDDVTVISTNGDTVSFSANTGTIKNLNFVYLGEDPKPFVVNMVKGKLILEDCDLRGNKATNTIRVEKDADPIIRNNHIHHGRVGINISSDGTGGLIEHNYIYNNDISGIGIGPDSTPKIKRNKIFRCGVGVSFGVVSKGTLEYNHTYDNKVGIEVLASAAPTIRNNSVYNNECGIAVWEQGLGTIEDNHVFDNEEDGILVEHDAEPRVINNTVHDCQTGIKVRGGGIVAMNDVHDNWRSGIDISCGKSQIVLFNRVYNNPKGIGELDCDECDILDNCTECSMSDFCSRMDECTDCEGFWEGLEI